MASEKFLEMVPTADGGGGDKETTATEAKPIQSDASYGGRTVFERYINLPAIVNFAFTLQASWEATALSFQLSLANGGPASLVYGCINAAIGAMAIVLSLAELASIDPVVGAQYRWSAAFAPINPEFWGLFQGWVTTLGWLSTSAGGPVFVGNAFMGLVRFNNESYVYKSWHLTMIMLAIILLVVVPNFWCRKLFYSVEATGAFFHFTIFIASIIILAVMGQWGSSKFVFQTLVHDRSGWTDPTICWGIGFLTVTVPLTGFDGTIHMSDEVKEPRRRVPYSMITSIAVNAAQMFVFMIVVMYTLGDLDDAINSPTGLPIIDVLYRATRNRGVTNFVVAMVAIIMFLCTFNIYTSTSRLVWSFATDKGLPCSRFFAKIHPTLGIPLNALLLVGLITALVSLITIGSTVAFYAILSLTTISLYISYFFPILFIMIRKLQGRHPPYGPFKLGRWGIPLNLYALIYILFVISFVALPPFRPVDKANMNYSGPLILAVIALALADWFISGRHRFKVPPLRAPEGD